MDNLDLVFKQVGTAKSALGEHVEAFAKELGLPYSFFRDLLVGDDWSFVIKLQAFVEAALTHLLTAHYHQGELPRFFERMGVGGQFGKLKFANCSQLTSAKTFEFISFLSIIRNDFVHDISNINIDIKKYIASLNDGQRKKLVNALRVRLGVEEDDAMLAKQNPKLAIYFRGALCISELYSKRDETFKSRALDKILSEGFKLNE